MIMTINTISTSCLIAVIYILSNKTKQISGTTTPNIDLQSYLSSFNNEPYEEEINEQQPTKTKTKFPERATLDLSGCLDIHVLSPNNNDMEEDERIKTIPLIKFGKNPQIPTIHLGFLYDFGLRWYGMTKLFSTFSWLSRKENANKNIVLQRPNTEIKLQKDLTAAQEDSISIRLASNTLNNAIHVSAEGNYIPSTSSLHIKSSIQTCIKRRLNLIYKLIHKVGNTPLHDHLDESLFSYKIPNVPQKQDGEELNWIVPDLQLGLDGRVIATNEMSFSIPSMLKRNNEHDSLSLGIRLVLSKKMFDGEGWFSSSSVDGTVFKLEMSALDLFHKNSGDDAVKKGLTTLVLESNLEEMKESTCCSIIHESLSSSF